MLKTAIETIANMAVNSHQPTIVADPYNPRKAYLIHEGKVEEKDVTPPLLNSTLNSIESLRDAVETFGPDGSVWYDRRQITVVLDNEDRLEQLHMKLKLSDQLGAIMKLPRAFDQRSLLLFLKRDLRGAIDPAVITPFRQLDFSKREAAGGTIKHGEESLGRSVQAAVANAADIPEFLPVSVLVFTNQDLVFRTTITLSVDIDIQRGLIELTPLPDEIENAFCAAENYLRDVLSSHLEIPQFHGVPVMKQTRQARTAADE